jgi:hypothetical protein
MHADAHAAATAPVRALKRHPAMAWQHHDGMCAHVPLPTRQGRYVAMRKTGHGQYSFVNSDLYEGEFREDAMSGHGVYAFAPEGRCVRCGWLQRCHVVCACVYGGTTAVQRWLQPERRSQVCACLLAGMRVLGRAACMPAAAARRLPRAAPTMGSTRPACATAGACAGAARRRRLWLLSCHERCHVCVCVGGGGGPRPTTTHKASICAR